jgi:hypothetical protein
LGKVRWVAVTAAFLALFAAAGSLLDPSASDKMLVVAVAAVAMAVLSTRE